MQNKVRQKPKCTNLENKPANTKMNVCIQMYKHEHYIKPVVSSTPMNNLVFHMPTALKTYIKIAFFKYAVYWISCCTWIWENNKSSLQSTPRWFAVVAVAVMVNSLHLLDLNLVHDPDLNISPRQRAQIWHTLHHCIIRAGGLFITFNCNGFQLWKVMNWVSTSF